MTLGPSIVVSRFLMVFSLSLSLVDVINAIPTQFRNEVTNTKTNTNNNHNNEAEQLV